MDALDALVLGIVALVTSGGNFWSCVDATGVIFSGSKWTSALSFGCWCDPGVQFIGDSLFFL